MLKYTVSSDQLTESDIYDIQPVSTLFEFLKPSSSLCIVKHPFEGSIVEMTRITGKKNNGEASRIYLDCCSESDLGWLKCKLDKTLRSPYLFISWKQEGFHSFKMVKEHKTIAEFSDFQSALDAYFPDGFFPEKCYRRTHSVFELMCMGLRRRKLFEELVSVIKRSKSTDTRKE